MEVAESFDVGAVVGYHAVEYCVAVLESASVYRHNEHSWLEYGCVLGHKAVGIGDARHYDVASVGECLDSVYDGEPGIGMVGIFVCYALGLLLVAHQSDVENGVGICGQQAVESCPCHGSEADKRVDRGVAAPESGDSQSGHGTGAHGCNPVGIDKGNHLAGVGVKQHQFAFQSRVGTFDA